MLNMSGSSGYIIVQVLTTNYDIFFSEGLYNLLIGRQNFVYLFNKLLFLGCKNWDKRVEFHEK